MINSKSNCVGDFVIVKTVSRDLIASNANQRFLFNLFCGGFDRLYDKIDEMVVLDATQIGGTALLGSPYAQGATALKIIPKRYLGMHQWLSPIATKDLKEQIVSFSLITFCFRNSLKVRRFIYSQKIGREFQNQR